MTRLSCLLLNALGCAALAGCISTSFAPSNGPSGEQPHLSQQHTAGTLIARAALDSVGTPYRYGGNSPDGFDCSGLVQYVHALADVAVPRTSQEQFGFGKAAQQPDPGDVLFFRIGGKISHAGIYVGNGRFVHAPSSGKQVSVARTDNPYFARRLVATKRLY